MIQNLLSQRKKGFLLYLPQQLYKKLHFICNKYILKTTYCGNNLQLKH